MSSEVFPKKAAEVIVLEFDFSPELHHYWKPNTDYAVNDKVRPSVSNGAAYNCSVAGQSAADEPADWPAIGGTTTEGQGALQWTGVAPSAVAIDTISSETTTAESGLTVDSTSTSGPKVFATISGGTAETCREVTCRIVTSAGETLEASVVVSIG